MCATPFVPTSSRRLQTRTSMWRTYPWGPLVRRDRLASPPVYILVIGPSTMCCREKKSPVMRDCEPAAPRPDCPSVITSRLLGDDRTLLSGRSQIYRTPDYTEEIICVVLHLSLPLFTHDFHFDEKLLLRVLFKTTRICYFTYIF